MESIAKRAGSSRSIVAEPFGDAVGISPIKYLTIWRLELAAGGLLDSDDSIAEFSVDIGYDSEASFKRHVGAPPAKCRTNKRTHSVRHA